MALFVNFLNKLLPVIGEILISRFCKGLFLQIYVFYHCRKTIPIDFRGNEL